MQWLFVSELMSAQCGLCKRKALRLGLGAGGLLGLFQLSEDTPPDFSLPFPSRRLCISAPSQQPAQFLSTSQSFRISLPHPVSTSSHCLLAPPAQPSLLRPVSLWIPPSRLRVPLREVGFESWRHLNTTGPHLPPLPFSNPTPPSHCLNLHLKPKHPKYARYTSSVDSKASCSACDTKERFLQCCSLNPLIHWLSTPLLHKDVMLSCPWPSKAQTQIICLTLLGLT